MCVLYIIETCGFVEFCLLSLFCFFKQKTAYEMRISDWSSDVCSSDLLPVDAIAGVNPQDDAFLGRPPLPGLKPLGERGPLLLGLHPMILFRHQALGRASCRERVCQYV